MALLGAADQKNSENYGQTCAARTQRAGYGAVLQRHGNGGAMVITVILHIGKITVVAE